MLQGGDDWAPKIRNALIRSHIGKGFGTGLRRAHVGLGGWDEEGCPCKRSSASWDWTKRTCQQLPACRLRRLSWSWMLASLDKSVRLGEEGKT